MYFGDSFTILPQGESRITGKRFGLTLWPISEQPVRVSLKSLEIGNRDTLKLTSVLAVFTWFGQEYNNAAAPHVDFPADRFVSQFKPESFKHPISLAQNKGFCYVLEGKEAPTLSKARCLSFLQVINNRSITGNNNSLFTTELYSVFPEISRFSIRFPIIPLPRSKPNFFTHSLNTYNETKLPTTLNWGKAAKLSKWTNDLTPIIPHIYIGSESVAKNEKLLKETGITHILNVASQIAQNAPGFVTMEIPMTDGGGENILRYIWKITNFIKESIYDGGNILVNCVEGVSRSVASVIAYMIIEKRMNYRDAFQIIREKRHVASPNPKFLAQLMQLTEMTGASELHTCSFSKEKKLKYGIIDQQIRPIYSDEDQPNMIVLDYSEGDTIYDANVIIALEDESLRPAADAFASDVRKCLKRIFAFPEWDQVQSIDHTEGIYITLEGGKAYVFVAEDEERDQDFREMLNECCEVHLIKAPKQMEIRFAGTQ